MIKVNALTKNGVADIYDYLSLLGVNDPIKYLKFNTVEEDTHYNNIKEAVDLFLNNKDKNIVILADSDPDGYLSSSLLYCFLKEQYGVVSHVILHDKNPKAHGLNDDQIIKQIKQEEVGLLFIPDAGTSDNKQCKALKKLGWEIIILDHHEQETVNNNAIVVNSMLSFDNLDNPYGSGTTVTWHFVHILNPSLANKYISYVAISLLSDSMSLLTNENGTFIHWGLNNLHNNLKPIVDEVQNDYLPLSFSFGGLIPKINSTIRLATIEEKKLMFRALCGETNEEEFNQVIEILKTYHTQQSNIVQTILDNNCTIDDETQGVLLCKLDCKTPLTGLLANKLMSKTGKPVLMLHDRDDGKIEGSVRSPIPFKDILNESNLFNYNQGHAEAFGTSYNIENETEVKKFLYSLTITPCINVLQSTDVSDLYTTEIDKFEEYKDIWANDLTEPIYNVTNVVIRPSDIKIIGAKSNTVKFESNGWAFIKFKCSKEWIDDITNCNSDYIILNIIGTLQWNEFRGKKTPQLIIKYIDYEFDDGSWLFS